MLTLARSLLLADAVMPEALAEALFVSATRGTSLVRALLVAHAIDLPRLEQYLERGDAPYMRHVVAVLPLLERLPPGLCERLLALPVRRDPRTGTVDVAVVDACDPHPAEEIAHWLRAPVRMVRTSLASLDAALRRTSPPPQQGVHALAPPIWMVSEPPPVPAEGSPDLPTDLHIPFALTRRSVAPIRADVGPPAIERNPHGDGPDPVVDLRRRKSRTPAAAEDEKDPATMRGPFGQARPETPARSDAGPPPLADVTPILDRIREAGDSGAILELALAGAETVAGRAAVFAVKRGTLVGWTCSSELAVPADFRTLHMAPDGTAFAEALQHAGAFLVRIPPEGPCAALLSVMRTLPVAEVVLVTVRVADKPVALLLGDDLRQPMVAAQRLEEIAQIAGSAISRLLRRR